MWEFQSIPVPANNTFNFIYLVRIWKLLYSNHSARSFFKRKTSSAYLYSWSSTITFYKLRINTSFLVLWYCLNLFHVVLTSSPSFNCFTVFFNLPLKISIKGIILCCILKVGFWHLSLQWSEPLVAKKSTFAVSFALGLFCINSCPYTMSTNLFIILLLLFFFLVHKDAAWGIILVLSPY